MHVEKYFDELYEYVDLWAAGYVKAFMPEIDNKSFFKMKESFTESIMNRINVINDLREVMELEPFSKDDAYDYYINNMPEFDDENSIIDLSEFDKRTEDLKAKIETYKAKENHNAKDYLVVMGAPEEYFSLHDVLQKRIDITNRLLQKGGYPEMDSRKTENLIYNLLTVA